MISAIIFAAHLFFLLIIFTKKWQNESLSAAVTNTLLIIILFSVGWSITTMLVKILFEPEGFGLYFNRDDISLAMLSLVEYFAYKIYYGRDASIADDKEK